ncbi:MAG: phosphatase PAP2 family protein [Bacteroidota bacterium]
MTPRNTFTIKKYALFVICIAGLMVWVKFQPQLDFIAALQQAGNPNITATLQFISDSITFVSFGVPLAMLIWGERGTSKKKSRLSFLYVGLSIGVAGLVSYLIKKTTSIPRPYEIDARITQWSVGGGYSFPSGHTTDACASAIASIFLYRDPRLGIPMLLWATTVAFSRIYLGVHYPFDILGGILIALTVTFFMRSLFQQKTKIFNR